MSDKGHTATYFVGTYTYCFDCESYMNYKESTKTVTEAHTWDTHLGGTECAICGWENACHHEGKTETIDKVEYGYFHWANSEYHCYEKRTGTGTKCLTCDAEYDFQWTSVEDWVMEKHTFENNVCTLCGYHLVKSGDDDMPKTGDRSVSATTWTLATLISFIGYAIVRKQRLLNK